MNFIWRLRTLSMFAVLTVILMGIGGVISFFFSGNLFLGTSIMLAVSILMCFISYYKSKEMALRANRVRLVSEDECPRLYSIVRDVAGRAGLPMPEIGITEDMAPNAFATGRNPNNAAVVCTRGILELLPDDELRGVIAHEMSHVKNRDIAVMSVASALAAVISYLARMLWWMAILTPSGKDSNDRLVMIAIASVAQILVPIAALLIQLGISRNREYLADETGARMIGDPRALARALSRLETGNAYAAEQAAQSRSKSRNPANDYDCAHMWIANPMRRGSLISRLFSTHPPMEERIARLNALADSLGL